MSAAEKTEKTWPYRLLIGDVGGSTTRVLRESQEELQVEIVHFSQPALLAAKAATTGGDLVVMVEPSSLAPLERLRNDPRTRHIPLILISSRLDTPEARFTALAAADQILDYPPEDPVLRLWVGRGLRGELLSANLADYATAKTLEETVGLWTGRISWVSDRLIRLETDVVPAPDARLRVSGPLLEEMGVRTARVRVLDATTHDVYYNHGARLELEVEGEPRGSLREFCEGQSHCVAPRKTKLAVLCGAGGLLPQMAALVDTNRYALRWIPKLDGLNKTVEHLSPALILVDPASEELANPMKAAALKRIRDDGPLIVPLSVPESPKLWERLGERCPTLEVPDLDDAAAWNALLDRLLKGRAKDPAVEGRAYLRREHRFSHARLEVPCELVEISEAGGAIRMEHRVFPNARARFDLSGMKELGIERLHGRTLGGGKKGERILVVWMGIGGEAETTLLRRQVSELIMAARRQEFRDS